MPTVSEMVAFFLALHLIAGDHTPTDGEVGWMLWLDNGAVVWETGRLLGLVNQGEKAWAEIRPFNPPVDLRHDLGTLRYRAHPAPKRAGN